MKVELEAEGERKTATVNEAGNVYIKKDLAGEEIELAYEVRD